MKVLFIIPPTDLSDSYGDLKKFANATPSIGIAYLASMVESAGHKTAILDAYAMQLSEARILAEIRRFSPDVIGISVLSTSFTIVEKLVQSIYSSFPGIRIVMGNVHASLYVDSILKDGLADAIAHREGEYTIVDILNAWEDGRSLEGIPGLSWRDRHGNVHHGGARDLIHDLDSIPFPAWHLYDLGHYTSDPRTCLPGFDGSHEMQILGTRGCPNACTFCSSSQTRSQGRVYRMRSPKSIADEIEFDLREYDARVFSFMDLAFPLVKNHALAVCDEFRSRNLHKKIGWMSECRVHPLSREVLEAIYSAGCRRVCFGIESGNQATLDLLRKNFTVEHVREAVRTAQQIGLEVDGMFMIGLPGETLAMAKNTVNFAVELGVRYAIFNIFVPYPGCDLYTSLDAEGKISYNSWSDFTSYPSYTNRSPVYVPDGIQHQEILELQRWAMRRFYLRPAFIWSQLRRFRFSHLPHYLSGLKEIATR